MYSRISIAAAALTHGVLSLKVKSDEMEEGVTPRTRALQPTKGPSPEDLPKDVPAMPELSLGLSRADTCSVGRNTYQHDEDVFFWNQINHSISF